MNLLLPSKINMNKELFISIIIHQTVAKLTLSIKFEY